METMSGGCHCGAVRFRIRVRSRVVHDCNCTICSMKGFLHLIVPEDDFELLQGADALSTYTFNTRIAKHHFCSVCGVHSFYRPRSHPQSYDVNLNCLDDADKTSFDIRPFDGREWESNVDSIR